MPITKNDVSFTYDVSKHLKGVPEEDREDAAYDAGEAALEKIVDYMDQQKSPVKGIRKNFDALKSERYKALKQKRVGNKKANLRLTGKMIESLDVDANDDSFTISVEGSESDVAKAYNHIEGDTVVARPFLPNEDKNQTFKADVVKVIKEAIARYKKPVGEKPDDAIAPLEVTTEAYKNLYATFQATKREQEIAKNLSLFKIEDIL